MQDDHCFTVALVWPHLKNWRTHLVPLAYSLAGEKDVEKLVTRAVRGMLQDVMQATFTVPVAVAGVDSSNARDASDSGSGCGSGLCGADADPVQVVGRDSSVWYVPHGGGLRRRCLWGPAGGRGGDECRGSIRGGKCGGDTTGGDKAERCHAGSDAVTLPCSWRVLSSVFSSTAADFSMLHWIHGMTSGSDMWRCVQKSGCDTLLFLRPRAHVDWNENRTPEVVAEQWPLTVSTLASWSANHYRIPIQFCSGTACVACPDSNNLLPVSDGDAFTIGVVYCSREGCREERAPIHVLHPISRTALARP